MSNKECETAALQVIPAGNAELVSTNALARRGLDLAKTLGEDTRAEAQSHVNNARGAFVAADLAWPDDSAFDAFLHQCLICYREGLIAAAIVIGVDWTNCESGDLADTLLLADRHHCGVFQYLSADYLEHIVAVLGSNPKAAEVEWRSFSRNEQDLFRFNLEMMLEDITALVGQPSATMQSPLSVTTLASIQRAAEGGDASAQVNLGVLYARDADVTSDYLSTVHWSPKGVDQGQPAVAPDNPGLRRISRDYAVAARWFHQAADQRDAVGEFLLAKLWADGKGVARDHVEACKWLDLALTHASNRDHQTVIANARNALAKGMTDSQIAEAERRARDWMAAFERRQRYPS